MIQMQTTLYVHDNSGAKKAQCIKTYKGFHARLGETILVSIKEIRNNLKKKIKVKKGMVTKALLTQTATFENTTVGTIKFKTNRVVLLDNKGQPYGNRILGPVPRSFRVKNY